MTRPTKSAEAVQVEVSRLVQQIKEIKDSKEPVVIPMPGRLLGPDASGCNWYMAYGGNAGIYGHAVRDAVQEVKDKWNLEP